MTLQHNPPVTHQINLKTLEGQSPPKLPNQPSQPSIGIPNIAQIPAP